MSTSLLYHAFGLRGYRHLSTSYFEGDVVFRVEPKPEHLCCPVCGSREVIRRGSVHRTLRAVPIGGKGVLIVVEIPRLGCACGAVRQAELGCAEPRRRHTKAFARYALELSRRMTIPDVARHLQVGWDTIKDIQKQDLQRRFGRPKLKHLRHLAIDEISIGHGHRYLTVVLDLDSGAVVFVSEGKSAESLLPFWRRLRSARAKIKAVAMDMSAAYISAVRDY